MRQPEYLRIYAAEAAGLASAATTTEPSYYPAIRALFDAILRDLGLPFAARVNTSEARAGGGTDMPDLALCDGPGDYAVVLCEVKLPSEDVRALARSTAQHDQVGRYLAQKRAVIVTNVREFALLTTDPAHTGPGPVPPEARRIEESALLWPTASDLAAGAAPAEGCGTALSGLVEAAVTRYAAIAEPESLARILARLARRAKDALPGRFSEAVQGLLDDFASALGLSFEDADGEEFLRSSLIQTAFYGLFAGWTLWQRAGARGRFHWQDCVQHLRIPFLGGLFHEFSNPTRMRELGLRAHLDQATEALGRVDAERFFARFSPQLGSGSDAGHAPETRAILYFYEPFLESFDPDLRKRLGVWYTPDEIVRYQVRRVDQLLRTELACPQGFADERVVVLDPCCGTGAYLIEVLRCIADELHETAAGDLAAARLLDALCRRVIGFEILTAPFVVAHLQLHLMMQALGATPDEDQRPAVFLTNALTGWEGDQQLRLHFPELQQEHDAARRVKADEQIIVVLGNPPYDRWAGVPIDEEADLVDRYKGIRRDTAGKQIGKSALWERFGVRKHLLDDLYIRFFRLAEKRVGERAPHGIVSFISNASYLAGRSHPIMRESLLTSFDEVWIDNLHGNRIASERSPSGATCETVFSTDLGAGIKVGTAISTLLKRDGAGHSSQPARVHVRDFWGRAAAKRGALLDSLALHGWSARRRRASAERDEGPRAYCSCVPSSAQRWAWVPVQSVDGYDQWPGLDELFPTALQGVNPNRGLSGSVVETDRRALEARMRDYFSDMTFDALREKHPELCRERARYDSQTVRAQLSGCQLERERVCPYLIFPFDARWLYYEDRAKLLNERRPELWANRRGNRFLVGVPQPRRTSEARPLVASGLFDLHLHDWGAVGFPEHLVEEHPGGVHGVGEDTRRANLAPAVWSALRERWGLSGDLGSGEALRLVHDLHGLALAVGHSPQYQEDHASALAQDWARIPIPVDPRLLADGAALGQTVAVLLDPQADASAVIAQVLGSQRARLGVPSHVSGRPLARADLCVTYSYFGPAAGRWAPRSASPGEELRPPWGAETGDLFLNADACLAHVPSAVWRYELGGYPVLKKWLGYREAKRREGAPLTLDEVTHLTSIVHRIAALLALSGELDALYGRAASAALTVGALGIA